MASVALVHWNEAEAEDRADALRAAGHDVVVHWRQGSTPRLGSPEVVVVSLDRLPSHGRAIADWLWSARRGRVPLLFTGGTDDQVAATRARFPGAAFSATEDLARRVTDALADDDGPSAG